MASLTSRVRNPKFEKESLHSMSWTRVVKDKFPWRRTAACCGATVDQEEIVCTIPHKVHDELVGTVVLHKKCLMRFLGEVPDEWTIVQTRVAEIKELFVR